MPTACLYDAPDGPYILPPDWLILGDGQVVGASHGRPLRQEVLPDGRVIAETCVELVASMMADGFTVTRPKRTRSPNGLAWPAVEPPWRPKRTRPNCPACSTDRPRLCRKTPR